ncbi:protein GVQW3 [Trichonephila clavipes]|nr:protein GVQW3 [Trichonephila clavipes]
MERSLEQRYAIKFCVRLRKNATETFQMLQEAIKDDCISRSQSGKWDKALKEGREEVADEPRSGRPTTARTEDNVDRVHEVLRTDRRLSIQQIADTLNMSTFAVHGIVIEDLQMRKVCAKLVSKVLTQDQKELRVLLSRIVDLIQNEPNFLNSVVTGDESWITSKSSNDPNPCDPERNTSSENSDSDYKFSQEPQPFNQKELSDLVKDLNLPKEASEILASRLKEKKIAYSGNKHYIYRTREKNTLPFFSQEKDLVFCNDVGGLLQQMGLKKYQPSDWRLFIDSSKRSLNCVLFNNGNKYKSIPIAHSVTLKKECANIAKVMETIKHQDHKWFICVDLKMVNFILGQQGGYTKFPYFMCLWDSHDKQHHWSQKVWAVREELKVGTKNVINTPLVSRDRIILPPLHINSA